MSYRRYRPVGFLGAAASSGDTAEQIVLRNQAMANVAQLRADALRLSDRLSEISEAERYSNSLFDRGVRRVLEALRAAGGPVGASVPIPKAEFAALIQNALAKLGSMITKAEQIAYAPDISEAYPVVEEVNRAARQLIEKTEAMARQAQPQRKEADLDKNRGTSGLGIVLLLPWIAIGVFVVGGVSAAAFLASMEEGDRAERRAADFVQRTCRQLRQQGESCDPEQFAQLYERALRAQGNVGLARVIREAGEATRGVAEAAQGPLEAFFGNLGVGGGVAIAAGGAALIGFALYAAWPYLTGVRKVGKRLSGER